MSQPINDPSSNPFANEKVVFRGKIGEVVHATQPDGRVFEQFRRPPGTRLIIVSPEGKILLIKEYRHEAGKVDLRLPGGKVCDSLEQFDALRASKSDMLEAAKLGAAKEAREEVGLDIVDPELITIAGAGATVEWDLYYFLVKNYSEHAGGYEREVGENIEVVWLAPSELKSAFAEGAMGEWRSVGVLLGQALVELKRSDS